MLVNIDKNKEQVLAYKYLIIERADKVKEVQNEKEKE